MQKNKPKVKVGSSNRTAEEQLLALLLAFPDHYKTLRASLSEDLFADVHLRHIWHCYEDCFVEHGTIDSVLLIGYDGIIEVLTGIVQKSLNFNASDDFIALAGQYSGQLKRMRDKRNMVEILTSAEEMNREVLFEEVREMMRRVEREDSNRVEAVSVSDLLLDRVDYWCAGRHGEDLVKTGFLTFDTTIGGVERGQYVLLAANPNVGKTTVAMNIANTVALSGETVLFFSLEMGKSRVLDKLFSCVVRESLDVIYQGGEEVARLAEKFQGRIMGTGYDLRIYHEEIGSVADIGRIVEEVSKEKKIGLVVVDYVQIIPSLYPEHSKVQQVSEISQSLKEIALTHNVPLLALSQLNRENMRRGKNGGAVMKDPIASDLKDSGALEAHADMILMLHSHEYQGKTDVKKKESKIIKLLLRKNRMGQSDMCFFLRLWGEKSWVHSVPAHEALREIEDDKSIDDTEV